MAKGLFIATFGCQMNEYDSLKMAQLLRWEYVEVASPEEADLILVNTCSIREKPENKVYSLLGRFKSLKKRHPGLIIGVGGCVAQQEGETILKRAPYVDFVFGPQGLYRLPELVAAAQSRNQGYRSQLDLSRDFHIPLVKGDLSSKGDPRAFVTIMTGCDNFCTYCVVPYVRGREISRPPTDIVSEVRHLVDQGVSEITLLGQNVNSYGRKDPELPSFAELLDMVAEVEGVKRVRFTTSHPRDMDQEVMRRFRDIPQLCEHLHLPVQSGSTRILKAMNRGYSREEYLEKVAMLREICPGIALTTDIIVGFPGETTRDLEDTLSLLEEVRFDQIFAFVYSPRPMTRAANMTESLTPGEKSQRLSKVLELQRRIGLEQFSRYEGANAEVLVDGISKGDPGELTGHTRGNHVVNFPGEPDLIGRIVTVYIEKACHHSLRGKILDQRKQAA